MIYKKEEWNVSREQIYNRKSYNYNSNHAHFGDGGKRKGKLYETLDVTGRKTR